ncbi:RNA polymerase sigma factor [Leadbetterella byssophila]|uniref:RNA polymerase, sigma-24 subunit, ECF subfamily n=1 Tax=Leadbetterella byssophila (strain DSM 17132 / JCM 16389 / KACC 11308 / NBRC 106382 / 4M15) TaxID=649349 RepID=E4RXJ6_LEAB4|nr:sigma-70 family RNA polymerase sigma factor [Leadbetterella byssophila]ADQ17231.1 RNA polymerase, sigma-24 subunit, ECF subfamily [Leadbetterella byssophila DSM 17132]
MENPSYSDKWIVDKVLSGNTQAFATIVRNTERLVIQIIRKMSPTEDEQKDLVQDVYLKAFQSLNTFKYQSKLSTWIGTIAYNTCLNHLQKKRIPISEGLEDQVQVSSESLENTLLNQEAHVILNQFIDQLPPLYRTLISLYHIEELSLKEISQITHLPEGTIKNYLFRARKILKDQLEKYYKVNRHEQ